MKPEKFADGVFFNLLPTLDNLRNWLLAPTVDMLSFFKQSKSALIQQLAHVPHRVFNRLL